MDTDKESASGRRTQGANRCTSKSLPICVHLCSFVVLFSILPLYSLPFSGPRVIFEQDMEEGEVALNFAPHFLDTLTGKPEQSAVRERTGTAHERSMFLYG